MNTDQKARGLKCKVDLLVPGNKEKSSAMIDIVSWRQKVNSDDSQCFMFHESHP